MLMPVLCRTGQFSLLFFVACVELWNALGYSVFAGGILDCFKSFVNWVLPFRVLVFNYTFSGLGSRRKIYDSDSSRFWKPTPTPLNFENRLWLPTPTPMNFEYRLLTYLFQLWLFLFNIIREKKWNWKQNRILPRRSILQAWPW